MSGQQIGTVVGGIIGAYFGGPAGAQLGMAIGGFVGGVIDPTKIDGPRIGDGQQQSSTDGTPIAWVMGTATIAGTLVQLGDRRDVKVEDDNGKGGPVVSHHEARQDFAIVICESSETRNSVMDNVLMVEQDGKIVYDIRSGEGVDLGFIGDPTKYVVRVTNAILNTAKWSRNIRFHYGYEDQLPDPTLEAISGVGNTPSYRGVLMMVAKDFNVTAAGDRIPSFRFTVASKSESEYTGGLIGGEQATLAFSGEPFEHVHKPAVRPDQANPGVSFIYQGASVTNYIEAVLPVPVISNTCMRLLIKNDITNELYWDSGWYGPAAVQQGLETYVGSHSDIGLDASNYQTVEAGGDPPRGRVKVGYANNHIVGDIYAFIDRTLAPSAGAAWTYTYNIYSSSEKATPSSLSLAEVITRICIRGGLTAQDIDVEELGDVEVLGHPIARQIDAMSAIDPLLSAYSCYRSEYDGQIHFKKLGAAAVMTVDEDDLCEAQGANDEPVESTTRNLSTVFPRKLTIGYIDPAQNYMPVTVASERNAVDVTAIGETTVSVPVVLRADYAKQLADKSLKMAYAALEGTKKYALPFARGANVYLSLCAGECVMLEGKRWMILENIICDGYLQLSTRYDRQSAYVSSAKAALGNAPMPPVSRAYSGDTTLIALSLPALRPQDTTGLYVAAGSPTGSETWMGCDIQISYDDQASWQHAKTVYKPSVFGLITEDEPTAGEPLSVKVNGDLYSVSDAQLEVRANGFAILHGTGETEIGQMKTATQDDVDPQQYELTGVARGQLGTPRVPATTNDVFTMLDNMYFLPIPAEFVGRTIYLRGVGFGEIAETADVISVVYGAMPIYETVYRVDTDGNARVDTDGNRRKTR